MGKHLSVKEIEQFCDHHRIRCLDIYEKQHTSYQWLCLIHNIMFRTNFKNIKKRLSRCKSCHIEKTKQRFIETGKQKTIRHYHELAAQHNFVFLSVDAVINGVVNALQSTEWRCLRCNTIRKTSFSHFRLVPVCLLCDRNQRTTENRVRAIFEKLTDKRFPKIRPLFLQNPTSKRCLELDGYNEELRVAFEYDGRMHYEAFNSKRALSRCEKGRHGTLTIIKKRDALKNKLCKKANITLIRIPYWINNIEQYITKRLINKGILK